jgi:hypothetical protein
MIAKTLRIPDGDFFIEIPLVVEIEVSGNGTGSVNSVNQEILQVWQACGAGSLTPPDVAICNCKKPESQRGQRPRPTE